MRKTKTYRMRDIEYHTGKKIEDIIFPLINQGCTYGLIAKVISDMMFKAGLPSDIAKIKPETIFSWCKQFGVPSIAQGGRKPKGGRK